MNLVTVDSSMIHAVGYDPEEQMLEVVFASGKTYQYFEVPQEEYDGLMKAGSKGGYMRANILDMYPYQELRRSRRRY